MRRLYNIIFMVEKAHFYCSKFKMPEASSHITHAGRDRGISYVLIGQRPAEIHNNPLSSSTHRIIFRLDLPTDRAYMLKWFGMDPSILLEKAPHYFIYKRKGAYPPEVHRPI